MSLSPKPTNPIEFLKVRFSIQSNSLWRVMKLMRPYRRRIILANTMSSIATAMAGFCLLSLHPLFQIAMAKPDSSEGAQTVLESQNSFTDPTADFFASSSSSSDEATAGAGEDKSSDEQTNSDATPASGGGAWAKKQSRVENWRKNHPELAGTWKERQGQQLEGSPEEAAPAGIPAGETTATLSSKHAQVDVWREKHPDQAGTWKERQAAAGRESSEAPATEATPDGEHHHHHHKKGSWKDAQGSEESGASGFIAGKFERIRGYLDRFEKSWPIIGVVRTRAEKAKDDFYAWAQASPTRLVTLYVSFIVFLYFLSQAFDFLGNYMLGQVSLNVTMQVMRDVWASVLRQEFNYFSTNSTGSLLNLCYAQVMQMRGIVNFLVSTRIMIPINMLIMFGVLLGISRRLSFLLLVLTPMVILPALLVVRRMKTTIAEEIDEESGAMDVMSQGLHGILAIKAFGAEKLEKHSIDPSIEKFIRSNRTRQAAQSMMGPMIDFMNMMVILVVFIVTMFVLRTSLHLDQSKVVLFLFAVTRFHKPLRALLTMNIQMQRSSQLAQRIFEILDRQPEIKDPPDACEFPADWSAITFEDVSLIYFREKPKEERTPPSEDEMKRRQESIEERKRLEQREKEGKLTAKDRKRIEKMVKKVEARKQKERPALLHVNLQIRRGEKIALIGPNGAGKSSMVNLLCRLYDPTEGRVLIDDLDFSRIRMSEVHERVCLVTQHPVLFNRSVRENIAFGLEDVTDDQIIAAARATGAHEFISSLPEGYDTIVGESGRHISGGERQKVALARAFVRNPDILILDEPTTGLDHGTTREFLDLVFHAHHEHLTLIFITHEPSQLPRFERILRVTPDRNIIDVPPMKGFPTIEVEHEALAGQQYPA